MSMKNVNVIPDEEIDDYEFKGEGAFHMVFTAKWTKWSFGSYEIETVAVKKQKKPNDLYFKRDVRNMMYLDHPNVIKLLGIIKTKPRRIVMEYVGNGDLLQYLLNYTGGVPYDGMVKLAYGIALGMQYLHHEFKPFKLHRDLSARNCLVGENWAVKVADFGRCNEDYEYAYYQYDSLFAPFPLRWMAPECIANLRPSGCTKYSRKNDVWAYGVVLFEIWTRGATPYKKMSNTEVVSSLKNGQNPCSFKKVKAKSHILQLMNNCWNRVPSERPNFNDIVDYFEENDRDCL